MVMVFWNDDRNEVSTYITHILNKQIKFTPAALISFFEASGEEIISYLCFLDDE